MSVRLDDYAMSIVDGFAQGVGDITRSAIADAGNAYQRFLMADATIGPPEPLTGTMQTVSYEMERDNPPGALETDPGPAFTPPGIDLDIER